MNWLQAMADDQSHGTEGSHGDTLIFDDQVLTEHITCQCDVSEDLLLHVSSLVNLVTGEVEDDL